MTGILEAYVTDVLAVERELHAAFRQQKHNERVKDFPAARELLARAGEVVDRHIAALDACAQRIESHEPAPKVAVVTAMGWATGLYDKVRPEDKVSRVIRDDYTALSLASVCYLMLHTAALATKDAEIAALALRHLSDFTPLIMDLSEVLPRALLGELMDERKIVAGESIADEAVRNARAAWSEAATRR